MKEKTDSRAFIAKCVKDKSEPVYFLNNLIVGSIFRFDEKGRKSQLPAHFRKEHFSHIFIFGWSTWSGRTSHATSLDNGEIFSFKWKNPQVIPLTSTISVETFSHLSQEDLKKV